VKTQWSSEKVVTVLCSFALGSSLFVKNAAAEKILAHDGDWTVFSDGRVGAFVSYTNGDGYPPDKTAIVLDPNDTPVVAGPVTARGGGNNEAASAQQAKPFTTNQFTQGSIERTRIRSGMIANTFGFGVRGPLTEYTTVKGYIQIWAWVENASEQRGAATLNSADVRQGYVKVEGLWGSLLVGRSRGLFSRGATDIDVLYGHGYGVGYPGSIDAAGGPTQGQIGFGLLGSQFGAGVVYATPMIHGLQLSIGAFDPVQLQGAWPRTKWPRPEAELTVEEPIGKIGKFVIFGNGTYQTAYKTGYAGDGPDSTAAKGVTYGGRLELGPVHLGLSGLFGYGLGLNYALEVSDAAIDLASHLRKSDGYYAQLQVAIRKVDVSAGWGITRIFQTDFDKTLQKGSLDPTVIYHPLNGYFPVSVLKHQEGISCGAVYHVRPWLHIDLDLFRADVAWFQGEKQVFYVANTGMMLTW
jgi:hypothetical protein